MSRRYGRVTVEGFIEHPVEHDTVRVWRAAGDVMGLISSTNVRNSTIEYLPEPVTFKTGDAVRKDFGRFPSVVWVRLDEDRWGALGYGPNRIGDDDVRTGLANGSMVRLLPDRGTA